MNTSDRRDAAADDAPEPDSAARETLETTAALLIIAIGASRHCLLVARESGLMLRYSLPHIMLDHTYQLRSRPQTVAINCESTRCAIVDTNGILSLLDMGSPGSENFGSGEIIVAGPEGSGEQVRFERKDVWDAGINFKGRHAALSVIRRDTQKSISDRH